MDTRSGHVLSFVLRIFFIYLTFTVDDFILGILLYLFYIKNCSLHFVKFKNIVGNVLNMSIFPLHYPTNFVQRLHYYRFIGFFNIASLNS